MTARSASQPGQAHHRHRSLRCGEVLPLHRREKRASRGRALCLAALTAWALAGCDRGRQVILGPGVMAPEAPLQLEAPERIRVVAGHRLRTRAAFSITAKLLSKRRYRWDEMAAVVPWDFALAWGAMSDEALLAGTHLAQGDRRMFWHLYDVPLPLALIERASANVHLIPANAAIEEQLARLRTGSLVTLRGDLVDLFFPDGRVIPTSVSRYDRGDGACEILFVEEISETPVAEGEGGAALVSRRGQDGTETQRARERGPGSGP